jgi:hypothetical protein
MTPEGRIKAKVDKLFKSYPADQLWYFSPQAGPYGNAGVPDRIACVGGTFFAVECKADAKKKRTRLQDVCATRIQDAGGFYFLVFDAGSLSELEDAIEQVLYEHARSAG